MAAHSGFTMPSLRRDIYLGVAQLVFALLMCLIYVVFLTSFGGEFWIVVLAEKCYPCKDPVLQRH
jgi:hypothetical protein